MCVCVGGGGWGGGGGGGGKEFIHSKMGYYVLQPTGRGDILIFGIDPNDGGGIGVSVTLSCLHNIL